MFRYAMVESRQADTDADTNLNIPTNAETIVRDGPHIRHCIMYLFDPNMTVKHRHIPAPLPAPPDASLPLMLNSVCLATNLAGMA